MGWCTANVRSPTPFPYYKSQGLGLSLITQEETYMTIRINNAKRFAITCLTAGIIIGVSITGIVACSDKEQITYEKVFASQGDTLWTLVKDSNPSYKGDIRKLVYMASRENGGSSIQANALVMIPIVQQ